MMVKTITRRISDGNCNDDLIGLFLFAWTIVRTIYNGICNDDCKGDGERNSNYNDDGNDAGDMIARAMAIAMSGVEGDGNCDDDCKDDGERGGNCNADGNGNGDDGIATAIRALAVTIGMKITKTMAKRQ